MSIALNNPETRASVTGAYVASATVAASGVVTANVAFDAGGEVARTRQFVLQMPAAVAAFLAAVERKLVDDRNVDGVAP